jgi:hypothetical protein
MLTEHQPVGRQIFELKFLFKVLAKGNLHLQNKGQTKALNLRLLNLGEIKSLGRALIPFCCCWW